MREVRLVVAAACIGAFLAALVPSAASGKGGAGGGPGGGTGGGSKTGNPPPKDDKVKPFKVGEVVKDVNIDRLDGGTWSPIGSSGKVSLLYFASKEKLGEMRKLNDLLKGREGKLLVLGILEGIDKADARDAVKAEKEKIETPLAVDPNKDAMAHFTATGSSAVALVGTDGRLVYSAGSWDGKAVETQLDKLLPPPPKPADKPADKPGDVPPKK